MIFVNGDSITFGCELSNDDLSYIKANRYTHHISEKFGEVKNISNRDYNNDRICKLSIEWLENNPKPDFAIIQWSPEKRFDWYDGKTWTTISPMAATSRNFYNNQKFQKLKPIPAAVAYYSEIDNIHMSQMKMWSNVHHLECYLEKRKIPHYFWYGKGNPKKSKKLPDLNITYRNLSKWKDMYEMCDIIGNKTEHPENYPSSASRIITNNWGSNNGVHPNENGHKIIAEHISDFIKW